MDKVNESRNREADGHYKAAEQALKTGLLKWNPDYDTASHEFEKAGTGYKAGKALEKAKAAFIKSAECKVKIKMGFGAGKMIESAAMCAKEQKRNGEAASLFEQAVGYFKDAANHEKAATTLTMAAKLLEDEDPDKAVKLYREALDSWEVDGKENLGLDVHRSLVGVLLKNKKLKEALEALTKQSEAYEKFKKQMDLFKTFQGIVIIQLALGDYVAADKAYSQHARVQGYPTSEEGRTTAELLDAFENRDSEALERVLKKHIWNQLDSQMIKQARALKVTGQKKEKKYESVDMKPERHDTQEKHEKHDKKEKRRSKSQQEPAPQEQQFQPPQSQFTSSSSSTSAPPLQQEKPEPEPEPQHAHDDDSSSEEERPSLM